VSRARRIRSAVVSAGDRKSAASGSKPPYAVSPWCHRSAASTHAEASSVSPFTWAASWTSPVANAVLLCVPVRIGRRAAEIHSSHRSRSTSAIGATDHGRPEVRSSASSSSSHAHPYGRSQCRPALEAKNAASTAQFSGVISLSRALRAVSAPAREGRSRSRRTASHVWCTHECQSNDPANTGCSTRWGTSRSSPSITCVQCTGWSRWMLSIAMPSSRVAVLSSNRVASMAHIMQCAVSAGQRPVVDK
jgi:hypothetical protein